MSRRLRTFILISLFGFGSAAFGSNVEYFDNLVHERVLLAESWTGDYIQSLYSIPMNLIRIDLYQQGKGWSRLAQIPADQADLVQTRLVSRLTQLGLSTKVSQADQNGFKRVIQELKQEGLGGWVKEGRRTVPSAPVFSSERLITLIAAVFTEVIIETPKPQTDPSESILSAESPAPISPTVF